jgi:hypothetical protein
MQNQVTYKCDQHQDPFSCPDNIIYYLEKFDEYGIIIHDGGQSFNCISFCPWCGSSLPESKRDKWFDELEALGFDDPSEQNIPHKYNTNAWYRA